MFKWIGHVEIVTDRPEQTKRFYTEILGFPVDARDRVLRPGGAGGLSLVYLDLGGLLVRETYARAGICDPNDFCIELRQWF
jgi:catechol 2,3-dioxygenase-like lactoylglutathione lyase family enzyme